MDSLHAFYTKIDTQRGIRELILFLDFFKGVSKREKQLKGSKIISDRVYDFLKRQKILISCVYLAGIPNVGITLFLKKKIHRGSCLQKLCIVKDVIQVEVA